VGKSEPFWLWAVTDSEEVAVVPVPVPLPLPLPLPCGAASAIFAVRSRRESGSLPTTELRPLHECPRVLAYMAEPMLYSEEKDSRFSALSTSDRDLASDKEDANADG